MAILSAALPGLAALLDAHAAELPQKDDLCGPFWGLVALRAAGVAGAAELDQEAVALAAGTVVTPPPRAMSLPPGEAGRDDYRVALPTAIPGAPAGTSAGGLARAVEQLSDGELAVQPGSGGPSCAALRLLLEELARCTVPVAAIANVHTGLLWDPAATTAQLAAYLHGGGAAAGPPARWRVGHYVALAGLVSARARCLVVVLDSFRSRGVDGVQLQPIDRVAAAIAREGMEPGGVLLTVPAAQRATARRMVLDAGLESELWDNGSPDANARGWDVGGPPQTGQASRRQPMSQNIHS